MGTSKRFESWQPGYCAMQTDDAITINARRNGDYDTIMKARDAVHIIDDVITKLISSGKIKP